MEKAWWFFLRVGLHSSFEFILAHSKIGQLDVTILVHDDILQLQVTVDDSILMKVLQGQEHLSGVHPCPIFRKGTKIADVLEEFAATQVIHHKVQPVITLEGIVELHNERVMNFFQHSVLNSGSFQVLLKISTKKIGMKKRTKERGKGEVRERETDGFTLGPVMLFFLRIFMA